MLRANGRRVLLWQRLSVKRGDCEEQRDEIVGLTVRRRERGWGLQEGKRGAATGGWVQWR